MVLLGCVALGLALYAGIITTALPPAGHGATPRESGILYCDSTLETAATAVIPRVYGSASLDSIPGRYRYSYTLLNEPSSSNAIWKFVLDPIPRPLVVTVPQNWMWSYGYDLRDKALAFGSEGDDTPYASTWDSASAVPSLYDLQPGDSVSFRFVSDKAPSMIRFYVQGFYNDSVGTEDQGGLPPFSVFTNGLTGVVIGPATAIGAPDTPANFEAPQPPQHQAPAPNLTSASATVAFYLSRAGKVRMTVHDVSGRLVDTLMDKTCPGGYHSVTWKGTSSSGRRMPAGVYFFRLSIDGKPAGAQRKIMVR